MKKPPRDITICNIECLVMPNGEVIILGKTIGWVDKLGKYITPIRNGVTGEPVKE